MKNKQITDDNINDDKELAQEYLHKAYRFQMNGKINHAIENYQKSIEIYPTPEAYAFLGWAYSFMGKYDEAIEECKNAINLDSDFGNSYNDIGAYLIQQGKFDEAQEYLEKAMQAKRYATPHFPHYNLGRIYERKGQWFEALKEYKSSLDLQPEYELARDSYFRLQALLN